MLGRGEEGGACQHMQKVKSLHDVSYNLLKRLSMQWIKSERKLKGGNKCQFFFVAAKIKHILKNKKVKILPCPHKNKKSQ